MSASGFRHNGGRPLDDGAAAAEPPRLPADAACLDVFTGLRPVNAKSPTIVPVRAAMAAASGNRAVIAFA
jgi:hypothetical protein